MLSSHTKFNTSKFEPISNVNAAHLIGGFSQSYSSSVDDEDSSGETNNCNGNNCRTNCGEGQNRDCNTTAHCGA